MINSNAKNYTAVAVTSIEKAFAVVNIVDKIPFLAS